MSIMMLMMFMMVVGVGFVGYALGSTRRLPPALGPEKDPRLSEQDKRIELLELELERLRDQADFTEKLLTERSDTQPGDDLEGDNLGEDAATD